MISSTPLRRPRLRILFQCALILMGVVLVHRAILVARHDSPAAALPAAAFVAFGILAIAARLQRDWWMPKGSAYAGAGILAMAVVGAALVSPETEAQRHLEVWFFPWFLMTIAAMPPSPAERAFCASPRNAGRMFVGVSLALGAAYVLTSGTPLRF